MTLTGTDSTLLLTVGSELLIVFLLLCKEQRKWGTGTMILEELPTQETNCADACCDFTD